MLNLTRGTLNLRNVLMVLTWKAEARLSESANPIAYALLVRTCFAIPLVLVWRSKVYKAMERKSFWV